MTHDWRRKGETVMSERFSWNECANCEAIQGAPFEPKECPGKSIWIPLRLRDKQNERFECNKTIQRLQERVRLLDLEIEELEKQN